MLGQFAYVRVEKTKAGLWRFYTLETESGNYYLHLFTQLNVLLIIICCIGVLLFLILGYRTKFFYEQLPKDKVSLRDIYYLGSWTLLFLVVFILSPHIGIAQFLFFIGVFSIGYWMFRDQPHIIGLSKPLHMIRLISRLPWYFFLLLISMHVVGMLLENVFSLDLYSAREEELSADFSSRSYWDVLIAFLYVCIGAPLGEEMFFRGFIQSYFRRLGKWIAITLSAFLFSLYHIDISSFLQIFVIGLILGWLKERYQSIWAPILLHFVNNFAATIFSLL